MFSAQKFAKQTEAGKAGNGQGLLYRSGRKEGEDVLQLLSTGAGPGIRAGINKGRKEGRKGNEARQPQGKGKKSQPRARNERTEALINTGRI